MHVQDCGGIRMEKELMCKIMDLICPPAPESTSLLEIFQRLLVAFQLPHLTGAAVSGQCS